jgi:hypothetical protein
MHSSVSIATGYGLNCHGVCVQILSTSSRLASGPTQLPIQRALRALSPGVRKPVREANDSPPASVEVKSNWIYIFISLYILVNRRNNFTFFYALHE